METYNLNLRVPLELVHEADSVTEDMFAGGVRKEGGFALKRADVLRQALIKGLAILRTEIPQPAPDASESPANDGQ